MVPFFQRKNPPINRITAPTAIAGTIESANAPKTIPVNPVPYVSSSVVFPVVVTGFPGHSYLGFGVRTGGVLSS